MAVPLYFISDLHFHIDRTSQDDEKVRCLQILFRDVKAQRAHLYIVGDLFDFWFEYRYVIPRQHFDLIVLLRDLTEHGIEIHYLAGNHDYWAESFFEHDLGIQLHPAPIKLMYGGKRFWICHGDGILGKDKSYRAMRKIFRHPFTIRLFRFIHPDLGFRIARKVASTSRKVNEFDPEKNRRLVEQAYQEYALPLLDNGYDYVIMGHFHHPFVASGEGRTFINLGDWMHYYSFGYFSRETFELNYLNPDLSQ